MLNPFPTQAFAFFAYFLLRLFVASSILFLGFSHWQHRRELGRELHTRWFPYGMTAAATLALLEIAIGAFLFVGAHTQYAALLTGTLCIIMLVAKRWITHTTVPPRVFWWLLLGTALSLFITGSGPFAFDLPI